MDAMESQSAAPSALETCILEFSRLCNANANLPKLIRKWDRYVHFTPTDSKEVYSLEVSGGVVSAVHCGALEGKQTLTVSAPTNVMMDVLAGRLNPADAVISSGLGVFGAEEDVMKLDAITLVLWDW